MFILFFFLLDYNGVIRNGRVYCPNRCGHGYAGEMRMSNLKRHLKFECGVEPQFKCPYCEKRSRHKSDLKKHIISIHKRLF